MIRQFQLLFKKIYKFILNNIITIVLKSFIIYQGYKSKYIILIYLKKIIYTIFQIINLKYYKKNFLLYNII